ncbi:MAG: hypothetical protein JNM99_20960 [Verrucomicrobiaceae bacterium]|nr:hypothetical protein [Verrucomicrobiaceae bacterium]
MTLDRGPAYPPHLLTTPYAEWTEEEREAVRLYFLTPLLYRPDYAGMALHVAVSTLHTLTPFTEDEKRLYDVLFDGVDWSLLGSNYPTSRV